VDDSENTEAVEGNLGENWSWQGVLEKAIGDRRLKRSFIRTGSDPSYCK